MKRSAALTLILLLLAACAPAGEETASHEEYGLWFAVSQQSGRSDASAVAREVREWESAPTAQELVEALLGGPQTDGLYAPFPRGVSVRSLTTGEGSGSIRVDLSEQYGDLAGFQLTLADYCITLTLCQLPEITTVEILVEGEPIPYRERQELRAEDVLLPDVTEDSAH